GRNGQERAGTGRRAMNITQSTRPLFDRLADMNETALAVLLLAPAFVFISIIVVYPVATLVWNSFNDVRLLTGAASRWVGLENYALLLLMPSSGGRPKTP
ncbi:MAG: hypothetical protein ACKO15_12460, partial [Burkholderiales bacterium]